MPPFPLHLPTLQNWSCHHCGGCCRQHLITITPEERRRIETQNWTPESGIPAGQSLFVQEKHWLTPTVTHLAHQPDGACVFLDEKGLCRIHAKFGEAAKPLACRIYPYAFHPAGKELTVSLRFSCPAVAGNLGRSLTEQKSDLRRLAQLVVPESYRGSPPPRLNSRTQLDWSDTLRVVESLDHTLAENDAPVAVKLLRALSWLELIGRARLQKVRGERLEELLELLSESARVEIPDLPADLGEPSAIGLTQFRLLAGQYARKDTAATIDTSIGGRWQQLRHALTLARGQKSLPALNAGLAEVPFAQLKAVAISLNDESEEMLTRYFRVKLQGLHFCGAAYYGVPVIEGFESLSLVYPVVLWLARWLAASESRLSVTHADVVTALTIVDHQHGYSPALGQWPARRRVKNLSAAGDLARLIVWQRREG